MSIRKLKSKLAITFIVCMLFIQSSSVTMAWTENNNWTLNESGTWNVTYEEKQQQSGWDWNTDVYKCDTAWDKVIKFKLGYMIKETSKTPFLDEYYVLWINDGTSWIRTNGVQRIIQTGLKYNFEATFQEPTQVTEFAIVPLERKTDDTTSYNWGYTLYTDAVETGDKGIMNKKMVDAVFILDISGSMGSSLQGVKDNIVSFVTQITSGDIDINVSLITYSDIYEGEPITIYSFYNNENIDTFKTEISSISLLNGGDGPETGLEAIDKGLAEYSFREDASKYFILITDATVKEVTFSVSSIQERLENEDVNTTLITELNSDVTNQIGTLATSTGGQILDIKSNFATSLSMIANAMLGKPIIVSPEEIGETWEHKGEYWNQIDVIGSFSYPGTGKITVKYQIEDMNGSIKKGPATIESDLVSNGKEILFMKKGVDISDIGLVEGNHYLLRVYLEVDGVKLKASETVEFIKDDNIGPIINFEVPTNNNITYQALVNMTINDNQSGIKQYRYKWICNPPEKLMGPNIENADLNPYMGEYTQVLDIKNTINEQLKFRQSGPWYLFAQAVDNKGNINSARLTKELKIDALAPKIPAIQVEFDANGVMQINWSQFQEYTQTELDLINSENGYEYTTADGETVYVESGGGTIQMMSSGFGEMRLFLQKWGKIDQENYGWYNVLKDVEYIKITDPNQVSQTITDALATETIDGKGARYRVNIRHVDKAAIDYITEYGIKDEWDKNYEAQKFKDTNLQTGEVINIENVENISDSGWKETYANLGTVILQYQGGYTTCLGQDCRKRKDNANMGTYRRGNGVLYGNI
ncbi:MAG: hypothetical protein A2Y24_07400 [Clostridiales bacterium GWE2_32_10]|nr:MAG: hypothetical protein A2Y24_07400 [Clostridiales bacterium GWE2_32_10]HBY21007.1 hypothetical protein [Clostridiales bacterium]